MALYITAWDLPPDEESINAYNDNVKLWVSRILKQPGVKEFRAYRDPLRNSPAVMVNVEFDSLESIIRYLKNEDIIKTTDEMLKLGCSNFVNEMWDGSPHVPEPLRP